jgi:N-acylneuraminate cytidylyltransferase
MINFKDLTVIIPVREGSSRIKEKIFLPFDKSNLLEWKVNQLKLIDPDINILLSSNSSKVEKIAFDLGVNFHRREDFLSEGHIATFSEVITGIVKDINTNHFAWVTIVVPLMSPREYKKGFELYFQKVVDSNDNDSLVAVNLLKEYFWDDSNPINYKADKNHTISQELPNVFRVTNGLYMNSKINTLNDGYFLGRNPYKFEVPKISGIDIDETEDYEIARALLDIYKKNEKDNILGF